MRKDHVLRFICFVFTMTFFTPAMYSQNTVLDFEGKITLESYAGEWRWENEDKTETLILYLRDTTWIMDGFELADVFGTYKYTRNDSVVVDNTNMKPSREIEVIDMPIYGSDIYEDDMGNILELYLEFRDTLTDKESSSDSRLSYSIGRNGPQLHLKLVSEPAWWEGSEDSLPGISQEEADELKRLAQAARLPGWSIPNNVTLTKVVSK